MNNKSFTYDRATGRIEFSVFEKNMIGTYISAYIGKDEAVIQDYHEAEGSDDFGSYRNICLSYGVPNKPHKTFQGRIKDYRSFVVFEAVSDYAITNKKRHAYRRPYISFPCFEGGRRDVECSMLSYKSDAPFNYPLQWNGDVVDSLVEGSHTPLIVTNSAFETLVLSPFNHLMHNQVYLSHMPKAIYCGLSRKLKMLEGNTRSSTVMVVGYGVNQTIDIYGEVMQRSSGVQGIGQKDDILLSHLSYWTNAGSAYWYKTLKGGSYSDTLQALKSHHDKIGISFGSYQLDSWWYNRENETYTGGITDWEPRETVHSKNFNSLLPFLQKYKAINLFDGLKVSEIQKILGAPIGCHYKQLSKDSVYVKGGKDAYIIDGFAMPKDYRVAKSVFDQIFDHPKWHLSYVVHDWLQWMEDHHEGFDKLDLPYEYLLALDESLLGISAESNECGHMTMQLCMTKPSMNLFSSKLQSVTSIRSTCDSDSFFVEGTKRWWWHMFSARLIQAMGKYPFYDNRFTYKRHLHPFSAYSKLEMIWLALSCGPIGLGDPIGKENVDLIKKVIKKDGEIIKPDYPAMPMDQCYLYNAHKKIADKGVMVFSQSHDVYYLLAFSMNPLGKEVKVDYRLMAIINSDHDTYAVYNYLKDSIGLTDKQRLRNYSLKRRRIRYEIIAPIKHGVALFGDVSKHISMSRQLITAYFITNHRVVVDGVHPDDGMSCWVLYSEKQPSKILVKYLDSMGAEVSKVIINDYVYDQAYLSFELVGAYNQPYRLTIEY